MRKHINSILILGTVLICGVVTICGSMASAATFEAAAGLIDFADENGQAFIDSAGQLFLSNTADSTWAFGTTAKALDENGAVIRLMYVKAGTGGIPDNAPLTLENGSAGNLRGGPFTFVDLLGTGSTDGLEPVFAIGVGAIGADSCGWVLVHGPVDSVAGTAAVYIPVATPLFSSGTAGTCDSADAWYGFPPFGHTVTGNGTVADSSLLDIMFIGNGGY